MTILVIQNAAADPIGLFGDYLSARGFRMETWLPLEQPTPPSGEYSGLIILGGPMNACEDEAFPHLQQVVELIHQFSASDRPILGVCLGAQLIARAFGGRVYQNPVPELGFTQIYAAKNSINEPLLQDCPANLYVMQWHFDTFDLPAEAELLMSSEKCPNQLYRIRNNIYGVQFHPEVTPEIVRGWLAFKTQWIEENYPHLFEDIELQLQQHWHQAAQFAESIAQAWLAQVNSHVLEVA